MAPQFRRGRGGALPTGLRAWYKTDTLALADLATLTGWPDSSGNGNLLWNGAGTAYNPTFRTNQINGRPAVRFNGQWLQTSTGNVVASSQGTMFVVASRQAQLGGFVRLAEVGGNSHMTMAETIAGGGGISFQMGGTGGNSLTNWGSGYKIYEDWSDGLTFEGCVNGMPDYVSVPVGVVTSGLDFFLCTFGGSAGSYLGQFDIAEVLVWQRSLTMAERTAVRMYLADRFAIPRLQIGLVSYWKLDESAGANAIDSHSVGNTLIPTNGVGTAAGKIGNSRTFSLSVNPVLVQQNETECTNFVGSISVTLPTPAIAGNVLIFAAAIDKSNTINALPVGFTSLGSTLNVAGIMVCYKVATGGETVISTSFGNATISKPCAWAGEYSGLNTSSLIGASVLNNSIASAVQTINLGAVTAQKTNGLFIAFATADSWNSSAWDTGTFSNSFANIARVGSTASTAGKAPLAVASKQTTAGQSIGTAFSTTQTADEMAGLLVEFATFAGKQSLEIASNAYLASGDIDFTFACWLKLASSPNGIALIFCKDDLSANSEYGCFLATSTNIVYFYVIGPGNTYVQLPAGSAITLGTWAHFVMWHDSVNNVICITMNDGAVASLAHTIGVQKNTVPFWIGARLSDAQALNGQVDELGFWKRVLTPAERTALYNGGAGKPYPLT
jgi:hypothetical protein